MKKIALLTSIIRSVFTILAFFYLSFFFRYNHCYAMTCAQAMAIIGVSVSSTPAAMNTAADFKQRWLPDELTFRQRQVAVSYIRQALKVALYCISKDMNDEAEAQDTSLLENTSIESYYRRLGEAAQNRVMSADRRGLQYSNVRYTYDIDNHSFFDHRILVESKLDATGHYLTPQGWIFYPKTGQYFYVDLNLYFDPDRSNDIRNGWYRLNQGKKVFCYLETGLPVSFVASVYKTSYSELFAKILNPVLFLKGTYGKVDTRFLRIQFSRLLWNKSLLEDFFDRVQRAAHLMNDQSMEILSTADLLFAEAFVNVTFGHAVVRDQMSIVYDFLRSSSTYKRSFIEKVFLTPDWIQHKNFSHWYSSLISVSNVPYALPEAWANLPAGDMNEVLKRILFTYEQDTVVYLRTFGDRAPSWSHIIALLNIVNSLRLDKAYAIQSSVQSFIESAILRTMIVHAKLNDLALIQRFLLTYRDASPKISESYTKAISKIIELTEKSGSLKSLRPIAIQDLRVKILNRYLNEDFCGWQLTSLK